MEEQKSTSEVLRREIVRQSGDEARSLVGQAEKERAEVLARAEAEAGKIRTETLRKATAQADALRKRILSGVHLEAKKQDLRAREEAVRRIFALVREKLDAFRKTKEYGPFLKSLLVEGVLALDGTEFTVTAGDVEAGLLTKDMLASALAEIEKGGKRAVLSLSKDILPEGGVVVSSKDGRTRFDNSVTARMKRNQDAMRTVAAKALA